jgi:hypothetical protein
MHGGFGPLLFALALTLAMISLIPRIAAAGVDDVCDIALTYSSPGDNLCVPGIDTETNYTINGRVDAGEWISGTYYHHNNYVGGTPLEAEVYVSHKKRGFNKTDLYLMFNLSGEAVNTFDDEIRIGINPGTTAANDTMLKIFPWSASGMKVEFYQYDNATSTWTLVATNPAWAVAAVYQNVATATWSVEVKISLDLIPVHPVTGNDFRLALELISDDNVVSHVLFAWPPHYPVGAHDNVCANPQRWHPMSFGTDCYADLTIANGLYSCDAVYVKRGGAKSTEIAVNDTNEFHADVTNLSGTKNANNVKVFMTLLQLGISTAPIAMNYSETDAGIKNWFQEKWGSWLFATDHLDTGTPKPPTAFSVNAGNTNTDARFNWKPSDETRFGNMNQMVGSHKCTAAFVDYKDDPNMSNNFSYCNTTIVKCPTGQPCPLAFWTGSFFANNAGGGNFNAIFKVNAINEPFKGWMNEARISLSGQGMERIRDGLYSMHVREKINLPLKMDVNAPKLRVVTEQPEVRRPEPGIAERLNVTPNIILRKTGEPLGQDAKLKKMYGDRPIVVVEGYAPAGYKTGLQGQRVQLYRYTNYVAFVIDTKPEDEKPPVRPPVGCGERRMTVGSLPLLAGAAGLVIIGRRANRRKQERRKGDSR